jgi:hypothetical protein
MLPAMRWIALVVLAACSKDAPPVSPLVGQSRTLADRMCACRDAACADSVDQEWNALPRDQSLSADDVEKLAAETQRYATCAAAARK